jgi:hypothetical protein
MYCWLYLALSFQKEEKEKKFPRLILSPKLQKKKRDIEKSTSITALSAISVGTGWLVRETIFRSDLFLHCLLGALALTCSLYRLRPPFVQDTFSLHHDLKYPHPLKAPNASIHGQGRYLALAFFISPSGSRRAEAGMGRSSSRSETLLLAVDLAVTLLSYTVLGGTKYIPVHAPASEPEMRSAAVRAIPTSWCNKI